MSPADSAVPAPCVIVETPVVLAVISALAAGIAAILRLIYKHLLDERNFWRSRALRLDQQAEKATVKAEKPGG